MIVGRRRFKPTWRAVAVTLAGVSVFTALGLWQLQRADLKEAIGARFEQRLAEPYQALRSIRDERDIEYRKVMLQGRYDNAHSLLVDNQVHQGRAGYFVLTPLRLKDSDYVVLVNRGWAPWGDSRDDPAPITEPVSVGGVAGIAYFPSESALKMGTVKPTGEWPQLIPYIDIDALQGSFDGRLLPWVLWLAPEQQGQYLRDWKPVWMRPEKSRAYAAQWFAFALLSVVFFLILNLRKIE
jgi:surfeit locus 1 family protein